MEYTIRKLAQLAGISTRTLRYYDEIGILKPARISSSGYRIYGQNEVDLLQQIMFYKELGVELNTIKEAIHNPTFNKISALKEHRNKLLTKKQQIETLLANIDKTIANYEGRIKMSDKDKFTGFKEKLITDNEEKYGADIRKKYGNETVDKANLKLKNMTEAQYKELENLTQELYATLHEAVKTGDPYSPLAQIAAELHKRWLCFYWSDYTKEAHRNLAQMYVDDERFKKHYDEKQPGTAQFLKEAIYIYTDTK